MTFKLNSNNLAVGRMMPRGPKAEKRLKYIHVGPKGSTCVAPEYLVRVSLPTAVAQPSGSVIYPQDVVDEFGSTRFAAKGIFTMPEGTPAVSGPDVLIPQMDKVIPPPERQTASITVNGGMLLKMLKIATDVSKDSHKTVRLRLFSQEGILRIDNYREEGHQEFLGILRNIEYHGSKIPGDTADNYVAEEKPKQNSATMKSSTGRRFRS